MYVIYFPLKGQLHEILVFLLLSVKNQLFLLNLFGL